MTTFISDCTTNPLLAFDNIPSHTRLFIISPLFIKFDQNKKKVGVFYSFHPFGPPSPTFIFYFRVLLYKIMKLKEKKTNLLRGIWQGND